jgi:hypothetical protein
VLNVIYLEGDLEGTVEKLNPLSGSPRQGKQASAQAST